MLNWITTVGYIGGSILSRFISHKDKDNFSITALVRNEEKAKVLGKFGVKTILGSYANLDLLQATAAKSDIVIAVVRKNYFYVVCRKVADSVRRLMATTSQPQRPSTKD